MQWSQKTTLISLGKTDNRLPCQGLVLAHHTFKHLHISTSNLLNDIRVGQKLEKPYCQNTVVVVHRREMSRHYEYLSSLSPSFAASCRIAHSTEKTFHNAWCLWLFSPTYCHVHSSAAQYISGVQWSLCFDFVVIHPFFRNAIVLEKYFITPLSARLPSPHGGISCIFTNAFTRSASIEALWYTCEP